MKAQAWARETIGILATMGGRWGFLYWLPLLTWLVTAGLVRLLLPLVYDATKYDSVAYLALTSTRMGTVVLVWFGSGQLTLALGYGRGRVFRLGSAVTVMMFFATQLMAETATRVEQTFLSTGGDRVLALAGAELQLWTSGPLADGLLVSTLVNTRDALTTIVAFLIIVPLAMRLAQKSFWTVLLLVPASLLISVPLIVATLFEWPDMTAQSVAIAIVFTGALVLVWVEFRRLPVGGDGK